MCVCLCVFWGWRRRRDCGSLPLGGARGQSKSADGMRGSVREGRDEGAELVWGSCPVLRKQRRQRKKETDV